MPEDNVCLCLRGKLATLSSSPSEYCIFKVHDQLRMVNEKAYEPNTISIGPYHRDKDNLKMMEENKLRYLKPLVQGENLDRYVLAMRDLEGRTRRCYAELSLTINQNEFIEMMLLDGCFIIELFRKFDSQHLREGDDPVFGMDWTVTRLQRDLLLFENQLPFFVLCKLFDLIEGPGHYAILVNLAMRFFNDLLPGKGYRGTVDGDLQQKFKHLLGLVHGNWLPSFAPVEANVTANKEENWRFINCATELRDAGIKFEKIEGKLFDMNFRYGVMQVPPCTIEDRTESVFRNLIAYEQYDQGTHFHFVTDYLKFMDCLIDSPKDVEILRRRGIIVNWLGDDEVVSTMFNKINDSVIGPNKKCFCYTREFNEVNMYCNERANQWMAKLRRNYLNSPWAIISVLAAFVLLVLTFLQTLFTIKK